jgi:uncharacterized protein (TIGR03118 family)
MSRFARVFSGPRAPRRPRSRPALEALENRCLLAGFTQSNLVSDLPGIATTTDPNLVNPWGIALNPAGPIWIADQGTGVSTLYNATGQPQPAGAPLIVSIPASATSAAGTRGSPTGTVVNSGSGFVVSRNGLSGPAQFLFATLDGTISGWSPAVDPTHAIIAQDSNAPGGSSYQSGRGASYTGLTLASNASGTFLFAADFGAGTVDVFDTSFHKVQLAGNFSDPSLPAGFAPFNVKALGGNLFVEYARQDRSPGGGFVDVFNTNGMMVRRLASGGPLNAPFGVTQAPAGFGNFGNAILVGNFGDGKINAFDATSGSFLGTLADSAGNAIQNDHLWALTFGNGNGSDPNTLYLTAGIQNETHGLFASLRPATTSTGPTANQRYVAQLYQDLLGRTVDPSGQAFWAGQLDGGAARGQVVQGIENTTEFRAHVVNTLYGKLLNRQADPMGLSVWTGFLAQGGTQQQVEGMLLGSDEYFTRHGGTNAGFLQSLYQDLLHRAIDPTGMSIWSQDLAAGASRAAVATAVLAAGETATLEVQNLYQQLLHRAADPTGLQVFVPQLSAGAPEAAVIAALVSSNEYFARV